MAYSVTTSDIVARWRPLSVDETAVATVLLADAVVKLDVMRPTLAAAVASTVPSTHVDERFVTAALCDMVIRVLANPDANRSFTLGSDGAISLSYGVDDPRARIEVTAGDLTYIDRALIAAEALLPRFVSRPMHSTMNFRYSTAGTSLPTV